MSKDFDCDNCPLQMVYIGDIENCEKYCDDARVWVYNHDKQVIEDYEDNKDE